jgi:YVTN family beta-propeller protein
VHLSPSPPWRWSPGRTGRRRPRSRGGLALADELRHRDGAADQSGDERVAGDLWVPNLRSNTVTRVDIRRNRVKETIRVGAGPFVVPDDPAELWVASFQGDDVWRIRPH